MRAGGLAVALAMAPSLVPSPALADAAQDAAARDFKAGVTAFDKGDYRGAGEAFEAAYREKPHYAPLWNAARAWEKAGEKTRAANLYAHYLRDAPQGARDRDRATKALAALAAKLARFEVHAAGLTDLELDGQPVEADAEVYVTPGDHVATARAGQEVVRKTEHADAGQTVSVALVAPEAPPEAPPAAPPTEPEHHGWSPVVVAFGGAVFTVLGGLAIWSGVDTLKQKDAFDQQPTQDNLDSGRAKETRTNALLAGVAGVGLLTAACAIFLVDWKGAAKEHVEVGVGPGAFSLRGSF